MIYSNETDFAVYGKRTLRPAKNLKKMKLNAKSEQVSLLLP
jgi:hypothetical protein